MGGVVSWVISELSTYFNSQAFAVVGNSSLQRLSAGVLVEVAASIIDNRQPLNQDDDAFTPTFASSRQHYNLATVYFTSNNSTIISRTRLSTMHTSPINPSDVPNSFPKLFLRISIAPNLPTPTYP